MHLQSRVARIAELYQTPLPSGRAAKCEVLARVNEVFVWRLPKGRWTSNIRRERWSFHLGWQARHAWTTDMLRALVLVGLLPREEYAQHMLDVKRAGAEDDRNADLAALARACKHLGIPVPTVPPRKE